MTEQEKQDECERICGEAGKRDMHHAAPEMCPILLARWQNPKLIPRRRWEDPAQNYDRSYPGVIG